MAKKEERKANEKMQLVGDQYKTRGGQSERKKDALG
jgi:hypothetical protein